MNCGKEIFSGSCQCFWFRVFSSAMVVMVGGVVGFVDSVACVAWFCQKKDKGALADGDNEDLRLKAQKVR